MITALLSLALSCQTMQSLSVFSTVQETLIDSRSPSCQVINDRLAWMNKQAAEIDRMSRGPLSQSQVKEIAEMRKRWLNVNDELGKNWATMTVKFQLDELNSDQLKALADGEYQISIYAMDNDWVAFKSEIPNDWNLTVDPLAKTLEFSMPEIATQYCTPGKKNWAIEIVMPNLCQGR